MVPCSNCAVFFSLGDVRTCASCLSVQLHCPRCPVFVLSNRAELIQHARNTSCFLSDLHTCSVVSGQCTPCLVSVASPLAAVVCSTVHHSFQSTAFLRTLASVPLQCPLDTMTVPLHSLRLHSSAFCDSLKWFDSVNSDTWPLCDRPHGLLICFILPGLARRRVICHAQFRTLSGITLQTRSTDTLRTMVSRFGIVSQPSGSLAQFFQHWHLTPSVCCTPGS